MKSAAILVLYFLIQTLTFVHYQAVYGYISKYSYTRSLQPLIKNKKVRMFKNKIRMQFISHKPILHLKWNMVNIMNV